MISLLGRGRSVSHIRCTRLGSSLLLEFISSHTFNVNVPFSLEVRQLKNCHHSKSFFYHSYWQLFSFMYISRFSLKTGMLTGTWL